MDATEFRRASHAVWEAMASGWDDRHAYFEETARLCGDPKAACNWVTNKVLAALKADNTEIEEFKLSAERLAERFKVSQTPLREAFARLAGEGWV